jgi:hypothetical protein
MIGIRRTALFLGVTGPLAASLLAGCATTDIRAERADATRTVLVTQPADTVVVTRPSDTVVVTEPSRSISYPEGRYELRGDAAHGYYWAWVPAGAAVVLPPAPPAPPRITRSSAPILASRPERVVNYPEGRYELYGDTATGYYWVWIPSGFTPPAYPPAPRP